MNDLRGLAHWPDEIINTVHKIVVHNLVVHKVVNF